MPKINKRQEYLFIWLGFTLLVFTLLLSTGTITSGWHLVDDHEFVEYELEMNRPGGSMITCMEKTLKADLTSRFRPLYYVLRILGTVLWGSNLVVWSIVKAVETVLALVFLYFCARSLKCNIFYSILFSLVIMVGPQSVVWWKLGPQEGVGILFFAVGFFYINKWLQTDKNKYAAVAIFFLLLDALYKESFIMLLPFVILYIIYYHCMEDTGFRFGAILNSIKQCIGVIIPLSLIFIISSLIIVFFVGTNNVTYIGFDPAFTLREYYTAWRLSYQNYLKYFVYFSVPAVLLMATFYKEWKLLLPRIVLFLSAIIPQIIIYCKTGLEERYLIPFSFGFAGLFLVSVCILKNFSGIRKVVYTALIIALLVPHSIILIQEADYFTYRGHSVTSVLNEALESSDSDTNILAAYSPYVESDYTVAYWLLQNGREKVYMWDEEEKTCTIRTGTMEGTAAPIEKMDIILFYNPQDRHYCYDPDIDLTDYERIDYGTLTMCFKK